MRHQIVSYASTVWLLLLTSSVIANPKQNSSPQPARSCVSATSSPAYAQVTTAEEVPTTEEAMPAEEPGRCMPSCRDGYVCRDGKCVELCNPPCGPGMRCVHGECEPIPEGDRPIRYNYLGLLFGARIGLNNAAGDTVGDIRIEVGGRYLAFQVGPGFGSGRTDIRSVIIGHVPLQPWSSIPLFIVPNVGIGYTVSFIDGAAGLGTAGSSKVHNLFLSPGVRARYEVYRRMAVMLDVVSMDIAFLRFVGSTRDSNVGLQWQTMVGAAFLY